MTTITLKGIIDEDFVNYRVPSMTLMFPYCSFKCGVDLCQNSSLESSEAIEIDVDKLCERYIHNPISEAVVCQGLEPFDSFRDLITFVSRLRIMYNNDDDVVIYTGYNKDEIADQINKLSAYRNIIVKYGRYMPDEASHFDDILGVKLASSNQFAERIS